MNSSFSEFITAAVVQTKTPGSGSTNGTWTDGATISGAFTQSSGSKSIINQGDAVTVNAMFHYEGDETLTENNRLKINGSVYGILYIQTQQDLETNVSVKVISLRRLK